MTPKRLNQQQFIDAVKALLPDCTDPLELKQKLEKDIGQMGFAETLTYLTAYEGTGELLTKLHNELPEKDTTWGHDAPNVPLHRNVIETRNRRTGHERRPVEEIASRHLTNKER